MDAKGVIPDSVMEELENHSPFSPETPTELDSSLDIALSLEASENAAQGRCSYKSYAETSNHSNSAAQGCEQGSSLPEWSNEARSMVSSLPLLRNVSCQVIDNNFSKYTRRSKQFNQNAAVQRRSPDDDLKGNTDPVSSQRKPNSTLKRNRTTYAPMPDQSKLSPEIKQHQQYLEQKNQVAAKRLASKKNRDKAPPGSSANGEDSSFVENHIPDNRSSRCLDLDRTMQQKPRKKKHRPKVVTEDTSKRPPKPHTSKPTNPTEDPQTGRSYGTRKRTKLTSTTPTRPSKVVDPKKRNSVITSSKRKLNFGKAEHVERGGSFPRHTVRFKEEETVNEEPNEVVTIEESKTRAAIAASSQEIERVLTRYQKRRMAAQAMEGCNRETSSTAHLFGTRSMKSSIKTSRSVHGKRKRKRTFSTLADESKNFSATHGALCAPKNLFFGNGEINRMANSLFPLNLDGPRGHTKADSLRNKQRQKYVHMKVVVAGNPQGCTQTLAVYTSRPPADINLFCSFAFMSLASRYPFKPRKEAENQHESTSAPAEDPTLHLGGEQVGDASMDRGVDIQSHGGNIVEMVYGESKSAENSAAKGENSATEQSI